MWTDVQTFKRHDGPKQLSESEMVYQQAAVHVYVTLPGSAIPAQSFGAKKEMIMEDFHQCVEVLLLLS